MKSLTGLKLERFKCFASQRLPLRGATVLTGQNGMGKSSVIQALLLLRQSALGGSLHAPSRGERASGLVLNGEFVSLGTASDLLYDGAAEDTIAIELETADTRLGWSFLAEGTADLLPWQSGPEHPPELPLFEQHCYYLGAERSGPRTVHALSTSRTARDELGADGSLAVAFLDTHEARPVHDKLHHPTSPSNNLREEVTAWLGEISPGVRLATQAFRELGLARLSFSFSSGKATSRAMRPSSVGFGLSYTLPVIIGLLSAPPGSLVLIENPEAHLHPRGQMAMGELIARAAAAGTQVIVETHSDHVLNGLRIAVKERKATPEQVLFHYFHRATETREEEERIVHLVESPRLDQDGRLDSWPPGFFDQFDIALDKLV